MKRWSHGWFTNGKRFQKWLAPFQTLGDRFVELRGANAGRVIIKQTGASSFDIVGKFQGHVPGDNANGAIIKTLMKKYTDKSFTAHLDELRPWGEKRK